MCLPPTKKQVQEKKDKEKFKDKHQHRNKTIRKTIRKTKITIQKSNNIPKTTASHEVSLDPEDPNLFEKQILDMLNKENEKKQGIISITSKKSMDDFQEIFTITEEIEEEIEDFFESSQDPYSKDEYSYDSCCDNDQPESDHPPACDPETDFKNNDVLNTCTKWIEFQFPEETEQYKNAYTEEDWAYICMLMCSNMNQSSFYDFEEAYDVALSKFASAK